MHLDLDWVNTGSVTQMGTFNSIPGKDAYFGLSDELSADDARLDDFDPDFVHAALLFAEELGLPWPPVGDLDISVDLVERAEENQR